MDITLEPGFTLEEMVHILEDPNFMPHHDIANIYIEPPDVSELTDDDSGDENEGLLDNLNSRQLQAKAEIRFRNQEGEIFDPFDVPAASAEISVPTVSTAPTISTASSLKNIKIPDFPETTRWKKKFDIEAPKKCCAGEPDYSTYTTLSPVEMFELFMDEIIMDMLLEEIEKYTLFKNRPNSHVSKEELKCFIAILMLSGYNSLPGVKFYWDVGGDVNNRMVSDAMRRDRFIQIMQYMHCADNTKIDKLDRMYKLRPLMNLLKERFLRHFVPSQKLCFDESMIRYYGRHGCKQFIRGKPICFGYKSWCLNTSYGYLVNFSLYQGCDPKSIPEVEALVGKAASPLFYMLDELPHPTYNYHLYFDNLFTSAKLLCTLRYNNYGGTGTIRDNRMPHKCPLLTKSSCKNKNRGFMSKAIEKNIGAGFVRWMDNSVVTVASTVHGVLPIKQVKRYSRKDKKNITISCPNSIAKYNKYMGGTDLMDQNINRHLIGIRSKKWWWPIFTWLLDAACQNAWLLHKKSGRNLTLLEFKRNIVTTYLTRYQQFPKRPGARHVISDKRVSAEIRFDRMDHFVSYIPENKKWRCAGTDCKSIVRTMCTKCNIGVCINCFANYHRI